MKFKNWFEELEQDQTILPNPRTKSIWVSDPKNPEQVNSWKKKNTRKLYQFPLAKEKFIHFSLKESIPEIVKSSTIKGEGSTFAVSLSYGIWFPVVQFDHIIRKKKEKTLHPKDFLNPRYKKNGYRLGNLGEEIDAIIFQTDKLPKRGNAEEVIWEGDIPMKNAKTVTTREAIRMLKNTPYTIGNDDEVNYF